MERLRPRLLPVVRLESEGEKMSDRNLTKEMADEMCNRQQSQMLSERNHVLSAKAEQLQEENDTLLLQASGRNAEIERLRERMEELKDEAIHNEGVSVALREGYQEAKARVKELETINWALNDAQTSNLSRIEDLEWQNNEMQKAADKHGWKMDSRHITDEQIDAAWALWIERGGVWRDFMTKVFAIFGIERCKKRCGGSGGVGPAHKTVTGRGYYVRNKCPDCNGHGWVIGGQGV